LVKGVKLIVEGITFRGEEKRLGLPKGGQKLVPPAGASKSNQRAY